MKRIIGSTFCALLLSLGSAFAQSLPADGGAPGAALLAHFDAVASGEADRIRAETHPDNHAKLDEMIASGEFPEIVSMMQAFTPTDIAISGGQMDGDSATVDFTGTMDGEATGGSATLAKVGERWLVQRVKMGG